jgi:hypothetical protein
VVVAIKINVFWDMTSLNCTEMYQRFEKTSSALLKVKRRSECLPPKHYKNLSDNKVADFKRLVI